MDKKENEIIISDELQKSILQFFLKTSIPRIAKKNKEKALSEKKGQEIK